MFLALLDPDQDSILCHQAKIAIKTLITRVLFSDFFFMTFFSSKNDVNNRKKGISKEKNSICWRLEGQGRKEQDPYPYQNVPDPQPCT